jgi:hypothetical protein
MSTTRVDERARLVFRFEGGGGSATFSHVRLSVLPAELFTTASGIGLFQAIQTERLTRVDEHQIVNQN